ncbi:hypothetical protein E2C01_019135 [Portunus trituberculatus]|uniref:Uncharacterized protein n=1 Tax=Portunus trituberculatus TaxID=210409 RepID=A0A5B7DY75_PORTR|nr:hypothetical protein [Portunus trituberculatus]
MHLCVYCLFMRESRLDVVLLPARYAKGHPRRLTPCGGGRVRCGRGVVGAGEEGEQRRVGRQSHAAATCESGRHAERPTDPSPRQPGTEVQRPPSTQGVGSKGELRLGSRPPLRSSGPQREEPTRVTRLDGRHLTVCRQRRQTRHLPAASSPSALFGPCRHLLGSQGGSWAEGAQPRPGLKPSPARYLPA